MDKRPAAKRRIRVLPMILSFLWVLGLDVLNLYLPASPLSHISFFILLALIVYSIFGSVRFSRQFSSLRLSDAEDLMQKEKEQANADWKEYLKDLASEIRFFYLWLTVCILLALFLPAFNPAQPGSFLGVFYSVLSFYLTWLILETLLYRAPRDFSRRACLSREDFPSLYAAVDRAFADIRPKEQVFILNNGGSSLGAVRENGKIYVTLGAYDYSILTDAELTAVLLHERYLLCEGNRNPLGKAERLSGLTQAYYSLPLLPATILFQYPLLRLSHSFSIAQIASTEICERLALRFVREHCCPSDYASAAAKIRMLHFFDSIESREHVLFYEPETIREDMVSLELRTFRELFVRRREVWSGLLAKEIPDYGEYHLTYRQMCEELGCDLPQVELASGEDGDRPALLRYADAHVVAGSRASYDQDRFNWYLEPKQILDAYDAALAEGHEYSVIELRPVLDACDALGQSDRLIELCEKSIREAQVSNQAAHAHFLLGRELLHRYDQNGLEHILFAMDVNENYIREGSEMIEVYCRLFGLTYELEHYARRIREITQLAADRNLLAPSDILPFDHLTADTTIPEQLMAENIDYIVQSCGEGLQAIWQLQKEISENYYTTIYVVQFDPSVSQEQINEAGKKIFHYLDSQPRQYSFFLREECPIDPDTIADACVYRK